MGCAQSTMGTKDTAKARKFSSSFLCWPHIFRLSLTFFFQEVRKLISSYRGTGWRQRTRLRYYYWKLEKRARFVAAFHQFTLLY